MHGGLAQKRHDICASSIRSSVQACGSSCCLSIHSCTCLPEHRSKVCAPFKRLGGYTTVEARKRWLPHSSEA